MLRPTTFKKSILVVSADPMALVEIKMSLMEFFDVVLAANAEAAVAMLRDVPAAAVVLHACGSHYEVFTLYRAIAQMTKSGGIPILVLSDSDDARTESEAFAAGAADYAVRRGGTSDTLVKRIMHAIHAYKNMNHQFDDNDHNDHMMNVYALTGKTILMADDVCLNREIVENLFAHIPGIHMDFAGDGREAVALYTADPDRYDLILMDIHMPVMDGIAAAKAIRASGSPSARTVPIIALSANVADADMDRYLEAGMNGTAPKPISYEQLMAIMVGLISHK